MGVSLSEDNGIIGIWIDGQGKVLEASKEQLMKGVVFSFPLGDGPRVVRIWAEKERLFVLHVFGCDVAWPQDVYEYPLEFTRWISKPFGITELHEYLARGLGIPAVSVR